MYICAVWRSSCIEILLANTAFMFWKVRRESNFARSPSNWNPDSDMTGWSAVSQPSIRPTYHPSVFFVYLQLTAIYFPQGKNQACFWKTLLVQFIICLNFLALSSEIKSGSALQFVSVFVFGTLTKTKRRNFLAKGHRHEDYRLIRPIK
jgi:hypothetical protein